MRSIGLALAVVALLVLATIFVAGLLDSSRSAGSLQTGDCLRAPDSAQVIQVDAVDCTEPHELEVIGSVALSGTTYPGDNEASVQAAETCQVLFADYVGTDFRTSLWFLNTFTPTAESWAEGDRDATCLVFQVDPELDYLTIEQSARNDGR